MGDMIRIRGTRDSSRAERREEVTALLLAPVPEDLIKDEDG